MVSRRRNTVYLHFAALSRALAGTDIHRNACSAQKKIQVLSHSVTVCSEKSHVLGMVIPFLEIRNTNKEGLSSLHSFLPDDPDFSFNHVGSITDRPRM